MSDSTAVNMGDPSSMTDQGCTRNAVYNVNISENVGSRRLKSIPYKSYLNRDDRQNHGQYSFGGQRPINNVIPKDELMHSVLKTASNSKVASDGFIYRKDPLQRVNDYTKNIS